MSRLIQKLSDTSLALQAFVLGVVLAISGCTYDTYNTTNVDEQAAALDAGTTDQDGGVDMSLAKSVTGELISKIAQGGPSIQDDFSGEAQNFTAQFLVTQKQAIGGGSPGDITPVAEVLWAIGGNQSRRLISVFDGSSITGVAEHFTIKVSDQTDPTNGTNQTKYKVTITVARGVRGSSALPPTLQTYITHAGLIKLGTFILSPTENLTVPIPQNAGINSVMVTADSIGVLLDGTEFDFVQSSVTGALKRYNPMSYGFVPISPQADRLIFSNLTPLIGGHAIEFSITWGIDG
jgi:hypothetical protein